jgi:hypothetical protein
MYDGSSSWSRYFCETSTLLANFSNGGDMDMRFRGSVLGSLEEYVVDGSEVLVRVTEESLW